MGNCNVWLVRNAGQQDVSKAEKFGKVCTIFRERANPFDFSTMLRTIRRDVLPIASADDFVIVAGPMLMQHVLVNELMKQFKVVKLLIQHGRTGEYFERELRG